MYYVLGVRISRRINFLQCREDFGILDLPLRWALREVIANFVFIALVLFCKNNLQNTNGQQS